MRPSGYSMFVLGARIECMLLTTESKFISGPLRTGVHRMCFFLHYLQYNISNLYSKINQSVYIYVITTSVHCYGICFVSFKQFPVFLWQYNNNTKYITYK